ncbi:alkaline phosphatase [Brasilonema bromeliae]|uniref:Alkaline phosphatase n=1 Tax=Brasilonema bromeliae SPC951 TaxID=385972 RepID=A0ABX1P913_9CYAN|nr:alkaline phosphatase [Brasilonema bromeliae]NMG20146.1 alkaline phosphatase [Brasilonema bromeliae SPC951]
MIGDGMGWEMARAAAIYKQIQEGKTGATLSDFYTTGEGTGLSYQNLTGYTLATTYGTTIADSNGVFSTGNSALDNSDPATGGSPVRSGFSFNPAFNPGSTATGQAKVSDGAVGNLVGYDPERGGINPWTPGNDPEYIKWSYPDSANTATTLYTGVKSYNNAIGVDIFEQPLETILTTANLQGKSTGLVSSVPIDHATPGAAAASVNRRTKYDDEFPNLDNILQQELRIYQPTVLLGGGHPLSTPGNPLPEGVEPPRTNEFITESTYKELSSNPTNNIYDYTFLERGADAAAKLAEIAGAVDPNKGDRLLGLYGARGQNGNLPVSSANGDYSTTGLDNFSVFSTQGKNPDTKRPLLPGETDESFIAREVNENPTLKDLTNAALEVLGKDQDGFWLMVEGGDIDWSAHDNNIDNLIGTVLDFDKAITSTINWIENNGGWEDNLLIVTADHDHYLTLNPNYPSLVRSLGGQALTDLDTPTEAGHFWGSDSNVKYGWGSHSNRPVPVYYQGAESEVLTSFVGQGYESYGYQIPGIPGLVDQSQIYRTMLAAVTGSSEKPLLQEPQTYYGSAGNDVVYTGSESDTIYAGEGDNRIFVNNGDNKVFAGSGNDLVYAGIGNDVIYVGEGDNTVFAGAGNDEIYGGAGDDQFYAGAGDDLIYAGEGNNIISAGTGNDTVYVGSGENGFILNAGIGSVTIYGFTSDDYISRGGGLTAPNATTLPPELSLRISGNDTLISLGNDLLATLKWAQLDTVTIV